MKRIFYWVGAVLLLSLTVAWSAEAASVNNFTIEKFDAQYYLSRDTEGRSTLKTVETITANFTSYNQNHGIERAIPRYYDGHTTSLDIVSIKDNQGQDLNYHTVDDATGDLDVLRIGDADKYVSGLQTYIVTYTQRDVTKYFENTNKDEFYWDLNGSDWRVPIKEFQATLHIDETIKNSLTNDSACYMGSYGATNQCIVESDSAGDILVRATSLAPGQAITLAIGFTSNTFQSYEPSALEKIITTLVVLWGIIQIIAVVGVIIVCIIAARRWNRIHNRPKDIGTIVPEYLPPREYSVIVAANLQNLTQKDVTAFILDMAVRHVIVIRQKDTTSIWKKKQYELELRGGIDTLHADEKEMLKIFFPSFAQGAKFVLGDKQDSTKMYLAIQQVRSLADAQKNGLRAAADQSHKKWFARCWKILLVFAILLLSPPILFGVIVIAVLSATLRPLTDEGVRLRRYLLGLRMYISVAETERLRMLQSPEGADKVGEAVDGGNISQVIKLYEKVLPYATLFGLEKEWNKQLGSYYEQNSTTPDWYSGTDMLTAAAFASALNGLSSTAAYSTTAASSSSSGGSSGGGFSGGGGGGGGGGGW